jgi:hypothetical protein
MSKRRIRHMSYPLFAPESSSIVTAHDNMIDVTIPFTELTVKFLDFATEPYVWECFKVNDNPCFHEVFVPKAQEETCALGFICIA